MSLFDQFHELPPTAGLPMRWRDWLGCRKSFTDEISQVFGLPPLQLTCSGTAALVIALTTMAKVFPERKQVIIPAYTCPLVVLAIHHCGLKVKLCDLAADDFDFDFIQLASLINDQVLAVIPTHLGGRIANVEQVKKLAEPHQVIVIEDAAQSLGAKVGEHGDIVFFSLALGKGLTLYEGGLLTANSAALREQLLKTAQEIISPDSILEMRRVIELLGYTALYNPFGLHFIYGNPRRALLNKGQLVEAVGDKFDFKLPLHSVGCLRERIGANALNRLPEFIEQTRAQALARIERLEKINGLKVITNISYTKLGKGTWPFLMVMSPTKIVRDRILAALWEKPLGVSRLFIHALPDYSYLNAVVPQSLVPHAQDFADRMFTVTNSLWLKDFHFEVICQVVENIMAER